MITIIIMHNHTIFTIHFNSEFAPHSRLLSPRVTPHPTTLEAFVLMPSRWGACGGGPMTSPPRVLSTCLLHVSGAGLLRGSSFLRKALCLISQLGRNISEDCPFQAWGLEAVVGAAASSIRGW